MGQQKDWYSRRSTQVNTSYYLGQSSYLGRNIKGGYTGTHVPMSVPRLGLTKPGQTDVCPKLWAFSIKITLWRILHFFENRRLVCPKLRAFSELFVSSRCQWAFSIGQEGHTSQHSNVYVGFQKIKCVFWLFPLNLKDIRCNGGSKGMLDWVYQSVYSE